MSEMRPGLPPLIGEAPSFLTVMEQVSMLAPLDRPVLVIGERGTGKELVAARLHYLSGRWGETFLKLDCAALAESLLETELFGHEAGAFTGAVRRRVGRFELADGGSLFLDEIANASSAVQEKLLRAIEYGEIERVGSNETVSVDVRVIGATNADLPAEAALGRFRSDLLDRLAFDVLTLPPLRARREDVPLLAAHFGRAMAVELGWDGFPGFSEEGMACLLAHDWPGNVRELKNAVERSVYRHREPEQAITEIVFDPFASPYRPQTAAAAPMPDHRPEPGRKAEPAPVPADFKRAVEGFERRLVEGALAESRHNQRRAAERLGLSYHQFRHQMRKHGLLGATSEA